MDVKNILLAACLCLSSISFADEEASLKPKKGIPIKEQNMSSDVVKTPSGLAYSIIKEAPEGAASPAKGQQVVVHYSGWLDNGKGEISKKFDSSVDRGSPFNFTIGVGQVISGWDSGVMMMKVGEKRRLYIPANLGYGSRGAGGVIPANAALIFDVELLEIKK